MGAHDSGYKQLFSFPAMVADLIRGFVRERWVDDLDFDTLERKNGSYVSDDLREREDDIVWRVKWKGEERWIFVYFLIEFQSDPEPFMGIRLMTYLGLLYQDLIRTGEVASRDRLPPVLPMVVYRGERRWTGQRLRHLKVPPVCVRFSNASATRLVIGCRRDGTATVEDAVWWRVSVYRRNSTRTYRGKRRNNRNLNPIVDHKM